MGTTADGIYYPDGTGVPRREEFEDMAESVQDAVDTLLGPAFAMRARITSVQSISNATSTKLDLNGAIVTDSTNLPWDGTDRSFTAVRAGLYAVSASAFFAANSTGRRNLYIQVNGTNVAWGSCAGHASQIINASAQVTVRLAANDKVSAAVEQDSGGSLNVALAATGTFLNIARIGR